MLLVIDPVNDFLSEGGAAWEMTKGTVNSHDVIGHLRQAMDAARSKGIPVVHGPMAYTEEDYADGRLQCRCGINRLMFEQKMFIAGSWGADFHPDLRPQEGEVVLLPHKGTDVFETDLPEHLDRLGTTHIVIAGMAANLCCESTGRRAVENGYDVTFLSDAIGAENMIAYEASIRVNYPLIANAIMKVDEFIRAIGADSGDGITAAAGDSVLGSDRGKVGEVESVHPEAEVPYMTVTTGILGIGGNVYVPCEAVVKRVGQEVFINLPKLVVGKMPWDEPPTRESQAQKMGPALASVSMLYGTVQPTRHAPQKP
ncbi:MAG: cysteine hydrolase [Lautropia sp.]|nr:cysteine hydrolase [Lautropia sp.]